MWQIVHVINHLFQHFTIKSGVVHLKGHEWHIPWLFHLVLWCAVHSSIEDFPVVFHKTKTSLDVNHLACHWASANGPLIGNNRETDAVSTRYMSHSACCIFRVRYISLACTSLSVKAFCCTWEAVCVYFVWHKDWCITVAIKADGILMARAIGHTRMMRLMQRLVSAAVKDAF